MILGKYNKQFVFNYLSLFFTIIGMYFLAHTLDLKTSIICYTLVGFTTLLNTMMSKVLKNNSDDLFRMLLSSFIDIISFVVFPIFVGLFMGFTKWYHFISYVLFALAGIERITCFTIKIIEKKDKKNSKFINGLSNYSMVITLPLIYLISKILTNLDISRDSFEILYTLLIYISSLLFVLNINIVKPNRKIYTVFSIISVILFILICIL